MDNNREAVSEDTLNRVRRLFGPQLSATIEEWILEVPYPNATLEVLSREDLPHHIDALISVFASKELRPEEYEAAVARIAVAANEFMVRLIEQL